MKNIRNIILAVIALISLNACLPEDQIEFVAQPQGDFVFTNDFLSNYVLPAEGDTDNNIGILFAWESVEFDVQTNVAYELQYSVLGDFTDSEVLGSTSVNQMTLTIGQLKALAIDEYGYAAPVEGEMYFRVRAYPGEGSSETELLSSVKTVMIELLEANTGGAGIEISTWGIVGSGYNDWGAFADGQFYTTDQANVFVAYAELVDGEIKFRENNDWTNNYGDTGADGTLEDGGDNIVVTAGIYKIMMDLNAMTYTIEEFSWGVVGSGYNDWGNDGPDAKFYYDYTTDTFKVGVQLLDGEIKFRKNNAWDENYGDTGADGTLDLGGDNIVSTAGYYKITLDFNTGTYTIEEYAVWGVVGSGYNDWGNDGPDFAFTEVNPDVWVAEIVPLIDGEIKFRKNNAWDENYGDTGADGTLDDGGDNLIVVEGNYRIKLDFANLTYELNKVN